MYSLVKHLVVLHPVVSILKFCTISMFAEYWICVFVWDPSHTIGDILCPWYYYYLIIIIIIFAPKWWSKTTWCFWCLAWCYFSFLSWPQRVNLILGICTSVTYVVRRVHNSCRGFDEGRTSSHVRTCQYWGLALNRGPGRQWCGSYTIKHTEPRPFWLAVWSKSTDMKAFASDKHVNKVQSSEQSEDPYLVDCLVPFDIITPAIHWATCDHC